MTRFHRRLVVATTLGLASTACSSDDSDERAIAAFDVPDEAALCLTDADAQPGTAACLFLENVDCTIVQALTGTSSASGGVVPRIDNDGCPASDFTFSPGQSIAASLFFVGDASLCDGLSFSAACVQSEGCYGEYRYTYTTVETSTPTGNILGGDQDVTRAGACSLVSTCGNGMIDRFEVEACDDGNLADGDGCVYCRKTPGWECVPSVAGVQTSRSRCARCGDGVQVSFELCEFVDGAPVDGCDASCQELDGWQCARNPEEDPDFVPSCATECGDGILAGAEGCEQTDGQFGAGCDPATCAGLDGWTCEQGVCTPNCGDGRRLGNETCEAPADGEDVVEGCDPESCTALEGWLCEDGACATVCGDGIRAGDETCDAPAAGQGLIDGCDPQTCTAADGWICSEGVCAPDCGDGNVIAGFETCDEGVVDVVSGGCVECVQQDNWQCVGAPSICFRAFDSGIYVDAAPYTALPPLTGSPSELDVWIVRGPCRIFTDPAPNVPDTARFVPSTCGPATAGQAFPIRGDPSRLVLPVRQLIVEPNGDITVEGQHPLVIAVYGNARIEGTIDVSHYLSSSENAGARASNDAALGCTAGVPISPLAGGAGGGFGGAGGDGGRYFDPVDELFRVATGGAPAPSPPIDRLAGGCGGTPGGVAIVGDDQRGAGGRAGGTVQLSVAGTAVISGRILALGGGGGMAMGESSGGGGGGSGGKVILEAQTVRVEGSVAAGPRVVALGGGGGGAVGNGDDFRASDPEPPGGGEGVEVDSVERGGGGVAGGGTRGLNGQPGGDSYFDAVETSSTSAGGGGGGVGVICVRATQEPNRTLFEPDYFSMNQNDFCVPQAPSE